MVQTPRRNTVVGGASVVVAEAAAARLAFAVAANAFDAGRLTAAVAIGEAARLALAVDAGLAGRTVVSHPCTFGALVGSPPEGAQATATASTLA
jgi:hypothetical protein